MRDALLQDFENLSLERLSRIKRTLQAAEATAVTSNKTRLRSKPLGISSNAARNNNSTQNNSGTRLDLSRRVIEVSFKTLDGFKNGGKSGEKSRKHVYEACAAAIDSLYDIKRTGCDEVADYEAGKQHVAFILKLLDLLMVSISLIKNFGSKLTGSFGRLMNHCMNYWNYTRIYPMASRRFQTFDMKRFFI